MKITIGKLKQLIKEATGGDGKFELVDSSNWQHLEVGNDYLVKVGSERIEAKFLGWFTKDELEASPDDEDFKNIDLKFADLDDGMEWTAYWFEKSYAAGSGAKKLYVKEL